MTDKKTIAIALNTSWNIYNFRLGLLKALHDEGNHIVCIAPRDDYSQELEKFGFEYHDIAINNKGTNPIEDAKLVVDFYKLYKKVSPDVILQYTIKPNVYGSVAAGLLDIPVISNISGLGTVFLNDSLSSKIARLLYKVALKFPKKVFFQNAHDRQLFIDLKLASESKTDLLPGSGIDTEKFKPLQLEKRDEGRVKFLFIARLVKDKGLMEFVDAARAICAKKEQYQVTPEFYILGSYYPGNPTAIREDEMHQWEEEGIVTYLGASNDVQSVISKYDCIVLPSYREGLSRVLLEAASMAKPIVTTDVPGCKDVVDDGVNGYMCQVKDADSLKEAMEKMIALSDDQRREMGQRGREKVMAEFDEKLVIEKYKSAIKEIID